MNSATKKKIGLVLVKFRNPRIYNVAAVNEYKYSLPTEVQYGETAVRFSKSSHKWCNIVMPQEDTATYLSVLPCHT
jgi:hypothetical protein